jgi:heme/copper-type cytochrome/quinol oxidase subunit 4
MWDWLIAFIAAVCLTILAAWTAFVIVDMLL